MKIKKSFLAVALTVSLSLTARYLPGQTTARPQTAAPQTTARTQAAAPQTTARTQAAAPQTTARTQAAAPQTTARPQAAAPQTTARPQAAAPQTTARTQVAAPQTTARPQAAAPQTTARMQTAVPQTTAPQAAITKSDGSEFIIPEIATAEQLLAQAEKLTTTEMLFEKEEEYDVWLAKMLTTTSTIADRVLAMKTTDEIFIRAVSLKGQILCYQSSLDAKVLPKLNAFAASLEKNARVQGLEDGRDATLAFRGVYLQAKVADIVERSGTAQEMKAAMNEVAAFVAQHPETSDMTTDLVYPVAVLAAELKDPKLPGEIWTPIRAQLQKAGDADSLRAAESLDGAIRFSQLEGATFKWFGRTIDGKIFDPKTLQGKIVVLDFWAICDSCEAVRQELATLYQKYNAQGLEIVGYNLDGDVKEAQTYLTTKAVPWTTLSDVQTVAAKETSLARYYGIEEIPTLILIDGTGKVAGLDVDVETLKATLDRTFGGATATPGTAQPAAQPATSGAAAQPAAQPATSGVAQPAAPVQPGRAGLGSGIGRAVRSGLRGR